MKVKGTILRTSLFVMAAGLSGAALAQSSPSDRPAAVDRSSPSTAPGTTPADSTRTMPAPATRDDSRSAGTTMSDAGITAKVKASLIADDLTKARNINVDTAKATVTLKGTVESQAEADRAMQIARSTDGVMAVRSELKIAN